MLELARKIRMDLEAAQAKLVTLTTFLAAQPDAKRTYDHVCPWPHCRIAFQTPTRLTEHLANVHEGTPA